MKLSLELWESIFRVGRGAAAAGSERSRGGKVKEAILYPLASAHRPTQHVGTAHSRQGSSQLQVRKPEIYTVWASRFFREE